MTQIKQLGILLILLLLGGGIFFNRVRLRTLYDEWTGPALPKAREYSDSTLTRHPEPALGGRDPFDNATPVVDTTRSFNSVPLARDSTQDDGSILPLEYNLAVPFQPQAPRADWSMPYQEACEEASLIMADAFFNDKELTVDGMDASIKKLVAWEQARFGYYEDTTVEEVVVIAREYFNLKAALDYDVSVENIKKHVSQNKLVLVPAAGKILPNPYFRNGGPLYHMLVVRGYTQSQFITNDPGTKRGKEFVYKYDDLLKAVHAWPAAARLQRRAMAGVPPREYGDYNGIITEAEMLRGEKVMLVLDKD